MPNGTTYPNAIVAGLDTISAPSFIVGTPPQISSVSPAFGPVGTAVTITGNNFGATQGTSTVKFANVVATPTSWSNTQIVVTVPAGAVKGYVNVTVGGLTGQTSYIVGTPPQISSISPAFGAVGTVVTINGTNFGATQGTSTVKFANVVATPTSWSGTQIVAPVASGTPTGSTYVQVTVGGLLGQTPYVVGTPPQVTSVSPNWGPVGTVATITGTNLGATQGTSTVKFAGVAATPTSWSSTQIVVPVASGTPTGSTYVQVTVGGLIGQTSFTVGTPATITSLAPNSGPVGAVVTVTGLRFGTTQGTSVFKFGSIVATPTSWSDTQVVVPVPSGLASGTTYPNAIVGGLNTISAPPFTVLATPSITSLSPATGAVGASVTIAGTNFGATQGTSTVKFNGTTATATSWSSTQIVVPVPSGATTGNVVVTVSGVASNGVNFIVGTPPSIAASVSPAPNAAGWNNINVTVTFTCTSGSSPITSCTAPISVATEGANQTVSGTVTDTAGFSISTNVTLKIDRTGPAITVSSPVDGASFTSANLAISGAAPDALSGLSSVTCNGVPATISAGNFSCNISLAPGVNLVVVRATDIAGSVAASILHVKLDVPLPAPNALAISPATVNMLIGDTQQFSAVDELGRPRSDASWTVSDTSLATTTTDSSPVLTAVALGQVTLTATVGSQSAQAQINIINGTSLVAGTIRWSAPQIPGNTTVQLLQAVPTSGGPDLYSVELGVDGNYLARAFTGDGRQMWQRPIGPYTFNPIQHATPDGAGGLIWESNDPISGSFGYAGFDAQTGTQLWQYLPPPLYSVGPWSSPAIRQDGKVAFVESDDSHGHASLVILDGATEQQILRVPIPESTFITRTGAFCTGDPRTFYAAVSGATPSIDADGAIYLEYILETRDLCGGSNSGNLLVLKVAPDNSVSSLTLDSVGGVAPSPGEVIPDGAGGALATWTTTPLTGNGNPPQYPFKVTHWTPNGSNTYELPLVGDPAAGITTPYQLVLGENGVAFATDGSNLSLASYNQLPSVVSFNVNSGQVLWSYHAPAQTSVSIIASADGGGLITKITDQNSLDTMTTFDPSGTSQNSIAGFQGLNYSWTADWYGSLSSAPVASISGPLLDLANVVWTAPRGNPSGTGGATQPIAAQVRVQIGATALGYVGSQNWLDDTNPNNAAPNKCNIFVHDVLKQVEINPPDSDKSSKKRWLAYFAGFVDSPYYPAQAGDWANAGKALKGWKTVLVPVGSPVGSFPPDYSLPGDVIAEAIQYSDATGHVGIIVNNLQHQTVSADSAVQCYAPPTPAGTITNTDYGFRPDNYVDPTGCRTHGLKKFAVVKRFFGQ